MACDPREEYSLRTGRLYYDAKLEALGEVVASRGLEAIFSPEGPVVGPNPCPYRCFGLLRQDFTTGLKQAKSFVDGLKRKRLTESDVARFLSKSVNISHTEALRYIRTGSAQPPTVRKIEPLKKTIRPRQ